MNGEHNMEDNMDTLTQIEQATMPAPVAKIRQEPRKVWAVSVRTLLKTQGIKGVSVKTPNYSMAKSIEITVPKGDGHICSMDISPMDCPACHRRGEAKRKLQDMILGAYPDLDDRSDSITDYFDFCLSFN